MVIPPLTFLCPACNSKLTVPASLAGVTGPCPTCGSIITAPDPAALIEPAPVPFTPFPTDSPAPVRPPIETPVSDETGKSDSPPTPIPIGPRHLPSRSEITEPVVRPYPEARGQASSYTLPPPKSPSKWLRFVVLPLFLGIAVFMVMTLLSFLQKDRSPANKRASAAPNPIRVILPEDQPTPEPEKKPVEDPVPAASTTPDAAPVNPPQEETVPPAEVAIKILEKFLAADSFEERKSLIETKNNEADLAKTLLGGPLPPVIRIRTDVQESDKVENLTDIFYNVDFENNDGTPNSQTILVRIRGGNPPVVVVDPFLDLFGGRLAKFAEAPSEKAHTFQVIIAAGAFCYDEHVPQREKKLTMKLLARDNTREITKAYFGKRSKIGEMLEDSTSGFRYGQARACTITLRWNTEEDPKKPYLEAIDLKKLNWNP